MKKIGFILAASFIALAVMGQENTVSPEKIKIRLSAQVEYYKGNKITDAPEFKFDGTLTMLKKAGTTGYYTL